MSQQRLSCVSGLRRFLTDKCVRLSTAGGKVMFFSYVKDADIHGVYTTYEFRRVEGERAITVEPSGIYLTPLPPLPRCSVEVLLHALLFTLRTMRMDKVLDEDCHASGECWTPCDDDLAGARAHKH